MKNKRNHFWLLRLVLFACLSFTLSCTRPEKPLKEGFKHRFPQGDDDNLIPIDLLRLSSNGTLLEDDNPYSFKGLKDSISKPDSLLKIKTVSEGEKVKVSASQKGHIDPKISFINEYELLDYKIAKPRTEFQKKLSRLLGKVEFHGFPDTEYYIAPHFERNYFMLYKVGRQKDIPYDEVHLGVKVGDKMAVPLAGYPIKYCKGEVKLDDYDQETGLSRAACEGVSITEADYILLYENTKKKFEYLPKRDLFPKDFFNGKWFYARTIVKSPEKREVGHRPFEAAHLVEFHQTPDKLEVKDASGYNFEEEDKVRAFFIPIERQDYRIKRDSENIADSFEEELKDKSHDITRPWFTIKFDELVANEIEFEGEKSLKNRYITNDYISFDIEVTQKGSGAYLLTYAFRRAIENPDYVEKQWFEEDSAGFFPVFAEKRRYYKLATDHTQADNDRFFRITRFDPKKGEIRWYFSKQSSKENWVRDIGRQAVALLNRAFQIAAEGSKNKIKIVLDESEDKGVGDIRYNVLNLIVSEAAGGGLFGLGPNVANPITGEAISATANVWVSNIVASYIDILRLYIRFQVYPPTWRIRSSPVYGVTDFLHERIQKNCPEVKKFICSKVSAPRICGSSHNKQRNEGWEELKFHPKNPPLQDKEVLNSCAHKISRIQILETTLHEMLHGVGLRHVFSASADSENFYNSYKEMRKLFGVNFGGKISLKETKSHPHPPKFSSVMDYFNLYYPILFVPGKLDVAALRFVYFDKVELVNPGAEPFLEVPAGADKDLKNPQKSILATIKAKNLKREDIKSYRVCGGKKPRLGDFSYGELSPDDPLCAKWDYGDTPLAVVENVISGVYRFLMMERNRYDSEFVLVQPSVASKVAASHLGSIYNKWGISYRDVLLSSNGKTVEDYVFLDEAHAAEYKALMEEEAKRNSEFKEYYDTREPLFNLLKEVAFFPVKHCVYKRADGSYKAVALENIEEKIINDYSEEARDENGKRVEFISCQSPAVKKWAKDNKVWDEDNKFGTLITEVGFFNKHRKYFIRPKSEDPIDEKSVFDKIVLNSNLLPTEMMPPAPNEETFWFVSVFSSALMVAEPDLGNQYYKEMSDYIFHGIDLNPYIDETNPHYTHNGTVKLDIPRDAKGYPILPRVLSYKIDTEISSPLAGGGFAGRQFPVDHVVTLLLEFSQNQDNRKRLQNDFRLQHIPLVELSRIAESVTRNFKLFEGRFPFLVHNYKEYQEYQDNKQAGYSLEYAFMNYKEYQDKQNAGEIEISLEEFILRHPAVLSPTSSHVLWIPYEEDSFISRLFQKFNEYSKCVEEHEDISCEDIEEKRAFIKAVLDAYTPKQKKK